MTHAHLLLLGLTILCELLFQDLITLAKNALAKFYPNRASIVYQIYGIVQVWCNCVVLYPSTLSDKHPSNCWFSSVYDDDDDFFFSTASPDNGSAVGENAEHVIKVVRSQNKEFVASQDFISKIYPACIVYVAFAHHVPKLSQLDQTGRTKNLTQPKSLTLHGTIRCIPTAQDCAT